MTARFWGRFRCLCVLATGASCLNGCAAATSGHPRSAIRIVPSGVALAPASFERSEFEIPLWPESPADGARRQLGDVSISTRADDVLLYAITIDNSGNDTFTQAQLVRILPDSSTDVVATLFADATVRGRRISVRGTASLVRTLPPDELLARVREQPARYLVRVRAERRDGSLIGYLGVSR